MKTRKSFLQKQLVFKFFALFLLSFIAAEISYSQNSDPKLVAFRKQFAVRYLQPEAHFALAQYYLAKDDKLQAFLIMEYARRYRFAEKDFDTAFVKFFGDNSPEPSDEAKKTFEKGYELLKQKRLDEAEKALVEAAKLAPKSGFIQGWVGRFFFKVKTDNTQALKYYFNAYFLDPHAYETEYVESRIQNIAASASDAKFDEMLKSGKSLIEISTDTNPMIVENAIAQMAKQWKNEYVTPLLNCMSNDHSSVRWFALTTLYKNADASFDETLTDLTTDTDLRKRGLAAYALIARRKEKSFDILKKMLTSEVELIRFDALSALVLEGKTAGLEILKAHRKVENNATLQKMIDQTLQEK